MKKLDIITINRNNREGLERTIKSVVNQTVFDQINFIIIDGGSTDGSKEIIEQYKDELFHYVSEPDNGIFNAMNKGIRASVSDYLLFLNSGDYLSENNVLESVFPYLDGTDIVYGNEIKLTVDPFGKNRDPFAWVSNQMNYRWYTNGSWHQRSLKATVFPDELSESFFVTSALPHQSTFIRASFQKEHPYSESFKLLGDWKFFREAWKNGCTYKHIPVTVSVYMLDGVSTKQRSLFEQEKKDYYANK